ncbi:thaumatin-like protein [Epithele typhae]|uniref:thaumatin-like protein n=1 Tax=Epithele typhae TaxID=378194 RepID=UPI0020085335|nr:thaumatin-like protein [Epithele typhae]KAH9927986.1 thaumatin-like protein [Epithele typhae]
MKLTFVALALVAGASARTFHVVNKCSFTIWPAIFTDQTSPGRITSRPNGWKQGAHTTVSFAVPDNWQKGRIWGRRDCDFSGPNPGPNSCVDGGCNGGLVCDAKTGTGVPPATLAEFTLSGAGNLDNYDVSVVDGFNLPMSITNNHQDKCHVASCPVDLNPDCPKPLKGPFDKSGKAVGCKSACEAHLAPDPNNDPNCCTGSHSSPNTCKKGGVQFYDYFKSRCKNSYVFAFDEPSGTALWTCPSGLKADYTITFCP